MLENATMTGITPVVPLLIKKKLLVYFLVLKEKLLVYKSGRVY